MYTATKRLYLNKTRSRVVAEGHPEASIFMAEVGQTIPAATAQAYGLTRGEEPLVIAAKAITAAPENKAITAPSATKRSRSKR